MNTITLTLEATPENLEKLKLVLEGQLVKPNDAVIPAEKVAEVAAKSTESNSKKPASAPTDPTVPEKMEAPKEKPVEEKTTITKTVLRTKGVALTKEGRSDEFKTLLKKYGADKLSGLAETDYEAFYEDLLQLEAE